MGKSVEKNQQIFDYLTLLKTSSPGSSKHNPTSVFVVKRREKFPQRENEYPCEFTEKFFHKQNQSSYDASLSISLYVLLHLVGALLPNATLSNYSGEFLIGGKILRMQVTKDALFYHPAVSKDLSSTKH